MEIDTSPSSSSPESSPSNDSSATRSHRMPDPDPEKIASLAQKLYESLKALKPSKNKTNVSIALSEFENILSRSQQVAVLTLASRRSRDDALSLQLSDVSKQIAKIDSKLGIACSHGASGVEPIPNPPPTPPPIPGGTRHGSLYLADGNIVVAAPSEGGTMMLFRVHQSMLALQSPVFAAMFTLPPPNANRDVYDGAPFVHMPDDAKDIESLLKVLYNPSELPHKRLDPLTPMNVRRTLAMATKYEMEALRVRIVVQLQADWPYSLGEWDRLETEIQGLKDEHSEYDNLRVDDLYLDERLPEPVTAIRLAMDWNIPKIMPSAVYHLSRLSTESDWLESRQDRENLDLERTARWDLLEAPDFMLLLKVRELIKVKGYSFKYSNACFPTTCTSPGVCEKWWDEASVRWQMSHDPLDLMKKFLGTRPRDLCKYCWNPAKAKVRQCRLDMWDEICECVAPEVEDETK